MDNVDLMTPPIRRISGEITPGRGSLIWTQYKGIKAIILDIWTQLYQVRKISSLILLLLLNSLSQQGNVLKAIKYNVHSAKNKAHSI